MEKVDNSCENRMKRLKVARNTIITRSRSSSSNKWYLSDDLIVQVLSRLPPKHLIKFKSVSRAWYKMTSESLSSHGSIYGLLYFTGFQDRYACLLHAAGPCQRGVCRREVIESCLASLPPHLNLNAIASSKGIFLNINAIVSSKGVFLFEADNKTLYTSAYHVVNPATKQCITLPDSLHGGDRVSHRALAFDPPHFKVVCFLFSSWYQLDVDIFSSANGKWVTSTVPCYPDIGALRLPPESIYLNGALYCLDAPRHFPEVVLVRFRLEELRLDRIKFPSLEEDRRHLMVRTFDRWQRIIGEYQGRLHYLEVHPSKIMIWMLKDFEMKEWVLKRRVDFSTFKKHHSNYDFVPIVPLAFHPELEIVFFQISDKILSYHFGNMRLEEVHKIIACDPSHPYPYLVSAVFPYTRSLSSLDDTWKK